jgi:hypothetical protein
MRGFSARLSFLTTRDKILHFDSAMNLRTVPDQQPAVAVPQEMVQESDRMRPIQRLLARVYLHRVESLSFSY